MVDFSDRFRDPGYPKALVTEPGDIVCGIQCRICHVVDGFICHQVLPDLLDGLEECLFVGFVARQRFHEKRYSMLVRDQGNDELFEV